MNEFDNTELRAKIIGTLSEHLENLEKRLKAITQSERKPSSSENKNDIQRIVAKITSLRELIDRIEIEIDQLDSRINNIESLRFKHRTES